MKLFFYFEIINDKAKTKASYENIQKNSFSFPWQPVQSNAFNVKNKYHLIMWHLSINEIYTSKLGTQFNSTIKIWNKVYFFQTD